MAQKSASASPDAAPPDPTLWRGRRFPWYGYLLINAGVWVLLALIYVATKGAWFSAVEAGVDRPAVGGLLLTVAACFLLASVYDFVFDRFSRRMARRKLEEPDESAAAARDSSSADS